MLKCIPVWKCPKANLCPNIDHPTWMLYQFDIRNRQNRLWQLMYIWISLNKCLSLLVAMTWCHGALWTLPLSKVVPNPRNCTPYLHSDLHVTVQCWRQFSNIYERLAYPVITSPFHGVPLSYIFCCLSCSNTPIQLINQLDQGCHWALWQDIKCQLPCSDTPILKTHLIVLYFSSWSCARCVLSVQNIRTWRLTARDKKIILKQPIGIFSVKALSSTVSTLMDCWYGYILDYSNILLFLW